MQIQNMNSYLEVARKKIIEKYHSDEYNNFIEILKKSQIYKAANGVIKCRRFLIQSKGKPQQCAA